MTVTRNKKGINETIRDYVKSLEAELSATKEKLELAESLSVTNILKSVDVDVDRHFQSVDEVVDELSKLIADVEDYELGIKVSPCIQERLEAAEKRIRESQEQEPVAYTVGSAAFTKANYAFAVMRGQDNMLAIEPCYPMPPIPPELAELQRDNSELRKKLNVQP